MNSQTEKIQLQGAAGAIEAVRDRPADGTPERGVAVIAHPHPLFGGVVGLAFLTLGALGRGDRFLLGQLLEANNLAGRGARRAHGFQFGGAKLFALVEIRIRNGGLGLHFRQHGLLGLGGGGDTIGETGVLQMRHESSG